MNPFTLRFLENESEFQVNQDFTVHIKTIRLFALDFYRVIVDEGAAKQGIR